jgi:phosphoribosylaminoimidazole-succinocarboxamide synthase
VISKACRFSGPELRLSRNVVEKNVMAMGQVANRSRVRRTIVMASSVTTTNLPLGQPLRGKVRDCYRFTHPRWHDTLIVVSTDRISAFDWVLPTPIPDKGRVLTAISEFWFTLLAGGPDPVAHHLLTTDVDDMALPVGVDRAPLRGRTMLVRRVAVIPFECVVRGWLAGSALVEYRKAGTVCGVALPTGLRAGDPLPEPIFTPATKATQGHDENVPLEVVQRQLGPQLAGWLQERSLEVYRRAAEVAARHGIVIADTKFEWGRNPQAAGNSTEPLLVDEVLTPDSSRFWPAADAGQGRVPDSFDKQFVRDWLEASGWDRSSPPPPLPDDVVARTRSKYLEACRVLTGHSLDEVPSFPVDSDLGMRGNRN